MQASRTCVLTMAALVIMAASTFADQLGDPAQELQIAAWVKGEPVVLKDGKGKHIYVIEFWQTVCPHSRASGPHTDPVDHQQRDHHQTQESKSRQSKPESAANRQSRGTQPRQQCRRIW